MIKNKLKIKHILFFLFLTLTVSCSKTPRNDQKFIEDNFLAIVDTVAYGRGTFISLPKDTIVYNDLAVNLMPEITYNKKIEEFVNLFFKENPALRESYKDVLNNGKYSEFILDSTFPVHIGKYHIFYNVKKVKNIKYAGRIDIENLKIYNDKAMLILTESVEKFGVTSLLLLKKEADEWKVIHREVLIQS